MPITYKHPGHSDQQVHGNWARMLSGGYAKDPNARSIKDIAQVRGLMTGVMQTALGAVNRVHKVKNIQALNMEGALITPANMTASYSMFGTQRGKVVVNVTRDLAQFEATHEIGHAMDQQMLGKNGQFGSVYSPKTSALRKSLDRSPTIQALQAASRNGGVIPLSGGRQVRIPHSYLNYMLDRREMFARAYAQWIAKRSRNLILVLQLKRKQKSAVPSQWTDKEFEPIAREFDALFGGEGVR